MRQQVLVQVLVLVSVATSAIALPGPNSTAITRPKEYDTTTCGGEIVGNGTYFQNRNYPSGDTIGGDCTVKIRIMERFICQLRLDFNDFELSQPTKEGKCNDAFFKIYKTQDKVPILCGTNKGQHVYVSVDPNVDPEIMIDMKAGTTAANSKWSIRVSQIACTSRYRAPAGCLQYHTETSAMIKSFNYKKPTVAEIKSQTTNVHLQNLNYAICIAPRAGFCTTEFTPVDSMGYIMAGDAAANPAYVGAMGGFDYGCFEPGKVRMDYIVIPGATFLLRDSAGGTLTGSADRYCGLTFPTVTSRSPNVQLLVVTDGREATSVPKDTSNAGFHLTYRMTSCA